MIQRKPRTFVVYTIGICSASVCSTLSVEEITKRINEEHPTGIQSKWEPSDNKEFKDGQSNPCACEQYPSTHKHYLYVC